MSTPTLDQLKRGLAIAEQIEALEAEMTAIFAGSLPTSPAKATFAGKEAPAPAKGKRSSETVARMKAAQQARWAKIKGTKASVATNAPAKAKTEAPVKKKRKPMSPAVKAKLAAAMKARWAAAKAGKGPAPTAGRKQK
jgi:hypothetical protein